MANSDSIPSFCLNSVTRLRLLAHARVVIMRTLVQIAWNASASCHALAMLFTADNVPIFTVTLDLSVQAVRMLD